MDQGTDFVSVPRILVTEDRHHPQGEDADEVDREAVVPVEAAEAARLEEVAEVEATAIHAERFAARPQQVERRALARDAVVRERQSGDVRGRTKVLEEGLGERVLGSRLDEELALVRDRLARAASEQPRDEEGQGVGRGRVVLQPPGLEVLPVLAAGAEKRTVRPPQEAGRGAPEDEAGVALVHGELTALVHDPRRLFATELRREQDDGLTVRDRREELRDVYDGRRRQLRRRHRSRRALLLCRHGSLRHLEDDIVSLLRRQPIETGIRSRAVELPHGGVELGPDSGNDTCSAHDRGDFTPTTSSHGDFLLRNGSLSLQRHAGAPDRQLVGRFSRLTSALYFVLIKRKKQSEKLLTRFYTIDSFGCQSQAHISFIDQ